MSDAVMVPTIATDAMIEAYFEACRRHGFHAHINATCAWEAMLAASTPVGGWEDTGFVSFPEAPPPPSVSTDNGSRPQEAVPSEGQDAAVVARSDRFAECYENGAHPNCRRCYRGEVPNMADDSGFWVEMGAVAGGANEHGLRGWIELIEHHPDGTEKRREYIATDSPVYTTPQCPICAEPFKADDMCAIDITEGTCHAACLEGSPVVDLDTEEPSSGPIWTFRYDSLPQPKLQPEPCGGCGEADPSKRCIGCLHIFLPQTEKGS